MNTTQLIKELIQFVIEITDEERKKIEDNEEIIGGMTVKDAVSKYPFLKSSSGSDPSSPYPTVQVQEATDWKTVLTRRVTSVIRVDGIEICRASGVDEGVLAAFCAYFVFNLTYPPHLKNTLVFLPRYVLKLTVDGDKPLIILLQYGHRLVIVWQAVKTCILLSSLLFVLCEI